VQVPSGIQLSICKLTAINFFIPLTPKCPLGLLILLMSLLEQIDKSRLPEHIAIIMDGNGRWAKEKGKMRFFGHQSGVLSVRDVVEGAVEAGVSYITLYTF